MIPFHISGVRVVLNELKWPTLASRRQYQSIIMACCILQKQTPIGLNHRFHLNTNSTRSHPLTLQIPTSSINALRYSFYVNTSFLWNSIPYEILLQSNSLFRSQLHYHLFCGVFIVISLFRTCVSGYFVSNVFAKSRAKTSAATQLNNEVDIVPVFFSS